MKSLIRRVAVLFFLVGIHFFNLPVDLFCSSLDGTSSIVYRNPHHVFSNGEFARGFVRMNGGFTIKPSVTAELDIVVSVSGSIDLRDTGVMKLSKSLVLDSGITWSSGGYISGQGNPIMLTGPLSIPSSKIIHIVSDLVIDGQNTELILNDRAQILVENNSTLTLRNITIKNTKNSQFNPCLKIGGTKGKLALENVHLDMIGDIVFAQGQVYIHGDVVFSGTSSLIYNSISPIFIAPASTLLCDLNTTLSFAPSTTYASNLFILQERTSTLYLNGATLKTTSSGMRLSKGKLLLSNKVNIQSASNVRFASLQTSPLLDAKDYGVEPHPLAWHPSGNFLAIGGNDPTGASAPEIQIYSFNGSSLTLLTTEDFGADGAANRPIAMRWNFDGTVLAVGGVRSSANELYLYRFNGATLSLITSIDYGATEVRSIAWHPSKNILAFGGSFISGGTFAQSEVQLYTFNGETLTALVALDYVTSGADVQWVAWHPSGDILAVTGDTLSASPSPELILYSFNGTSLTLLTSIDYGTSASADVWPAVWNPQGTVIAFGGDTPTNGNELWLYQFNGSSLSLIQTLDYGSQIWGIDWSPDGTVLAVTGTAPTVAGELKLYSFDGTSLTKLQDVSFGSSTRFVSWHPSGTVLALGGGTPTDTFELHLYQALFANSYPQIFSKSIVFGNSALGSDYDLNVEVLGGATVKIDGKIVDDSA